MRVCAQGIDYLENIELPRVINTGKRWNQGLQPKVQQIQAGRAAALLFFMFRRRIFSAREVASVVRFFGPSSFRMVVSASIRRCILSTVSQ